MNATLTRTAERPAAADRPAGGAAPARGADDDRAFEEGVRWFLAVSRRAACGAE